jgi:hypothetical protein
VHGPSFRFTAAELADLDRLARHLAGKLGGVRPLSRTDVLRYTVARCVKEEGLQSPSPEHDLEDSA